MKINKFIQIILTAAGFFLITYIFFGFYLRQYEHLFTAFKVLFTFTFLTQLLFLCRGFQNNIIQKLINIYLSIIKSIYTKPLESLHENVWKKLPNIGTILMFFCKLFIKFYNFLGTHVFKICGILFFIIPRILLLSFLVLNVFFQTKFVASIIMILLFNRLVTFTFFILSEFASANKTFLEKYLIITTKDKIYHTYRFNSEPLNVEKTQEKLDEYIRLHLLFRETQDLCKATMEYKLKIIRPILNPISISILLLINLKILITILGFSWHHLFLIFSVFVFLLERSNISKGK